MVGNVVLFGDEDPIPFVRGLHARVDSHRHVRTRYGRNEGTREYCR